MITLLTFHIAVALITILSSGAVVYKSARQTKSSSAVSAMWGSFGLTAATGVGLVIASPASLMHVCVLMSFYVVAITAIQLVYRKRISATV